jgi:hypothetical protein
MESLGIKGGCNGITLQWRLFLLFLSLHFLFFAFEACFLAEFAERRDIL